MNLENLFMNQEWDQVSSLYHKKQNDKNLVSGQVESSYRTSSPHLISGAFCNRATASTSNRTISFRLQ